MAIYIFYINVCILVVTLGLLVWHVIRIRNRIPYYFLISWALFLIIQQFIIINYGANSTHIVTVVIMFLLSLGLLIASFRFLLNLKIFLRKEDFIINDREKDLVNWYTNKLQLIEDENDLYLLISDVIRKISPKAIIVICNYNSEKQTLQTKFISSNELQERFTEIFTISPYEVELPVKREIIRQARLGKINFLPGKMHEALMEQFPRERTTKLDKVLKIHYLYAIGINYYDRLLGTVMFSMDKAISSRNKSIIETLLSITAISLERIRYVNKINYTADTYNHILNNALDIIGYKDESEQWKFFSDTAEKILKLNEIEYTGKTNYELKQKGDFYADIFTFFENNEAEARRYHKTIIKTKQITVDNYETVYEFKIVPVSKETDKSTAITISGREITQSREEYEALKRSEKQFRGIIQQLPYALMIINENGSVAFLNTHFVENFAYTRDEISTIEDWYSVAWPDETYQNKTNGTFGIGKDNGASDNEFYYYKVKTGNGKEKSIQIKWGKLPDNKMFVVIGDITQHIKARQKEKSSQQNLLLLSKSALEFITLPNQEAIFEYMGKELLKFFNEAVLLFTLNDQSSNYVYLYKYFGISSEKFENIYSLLSFDPYKYFFYLKPYLKYIFLKGKLTYYNEGLNGILSNINENNLNKIQNILGINQLYTIGLVRGGNLYGSLLLLTKSELDQNIYNFIETFMHQASIAFHQKKLESDLVTAKEKAEESDKLKSAFLANVSHEVRTPMNSIIGFTELLESPDYSEKERNSFIELIRDNSKQLMKLISDIVDISKIESNQLDLEYTGIDLNKMLDNLFFAFQNKLEKQNKNMVSLKINKGVTQRDPIVISDESRLRQVLTNLINNAIKFTNKGYVEFGYKIRSQNYLIFHVTDTGIGIDPMNKEQIFTRFMQGKDSEVIKNTGTGLGLSISKGLVELLNGEIWFESLKFKGTTFYFTIPYEERKSAPATISPSDAPIIIEDWNDKNILIVEDHKPSYLYIKNILEKTQVRFYHVDTAHKAVKFIESNPDIDIVLMDIRTPEGNGIDATKQIKEIDPDIYVIAQTAYASEEDRKICLQAGCDEYLKKPFTKDNLLSTIDHFLS